MAKDFGKLVEMFVDAQRREFWETELKPFLVKNDLKMSEGNGYTYIKFSEKLDLEEVKKLLGEEAESFNISPYEDGYSICTYICEGATSLIDFFENLGNTPLYNRMKELESVFGWFCYNDTEPMYFVGGPSDFIGNYRTFWREGNKGFTTDIFQAARFTEEEAKSIVQGAHGKNVAFLCSEVEGSSTAKKYCADMQYFRPVDKEWNKF
jgi:hypothetical protein